MRAILVPSLLRVPILERCIERVIAPLTPHLLLVLLIRVLPFVAIVDVLVMVPVLSRLLLFSFLLVEHALHVSLELAERI